MRRNFGSILALFLCVSLAAAQAKFPFDTQQPQKKPDINSKILETPHTGGTITLTDFHPRWLLSRSSRRRADGRWIWAKNVLNGQREMSLQLRTPLTSVVGTFAPSCDTPAFPSDPTPIDSACGISGSGGAEAAQNEAKNNFCATAPAKPIVIQDLQDLQQQVQNDPTIPFGNPRNHPLTNQAGPATDRTPLVDWAKEAKLF